MMQAQNEAVETRDFAAGCGRFLRFLVVPLVAIAATTIGLNVAVDPFFVLRPPSTEGFFKRSMMEGVNIERVTLAHEIRHAPPIDVLFLGSSRVRSLAGPLPRKDTRVYGPGLIGPLYGDKVAFNAAIGGANAYTMRRVLEHAISYHPIGELVFLVDDVMVNDLRPLGPGWDERAYRRLDKERAAGYAGPVDRMAAFADPAMAKASIAMIRGTIRERGEEKLARAEGRRVVTEVPWTHAEWAWFASEFARADLYGCYRIGGSQVGEIERILEIAGRRGVRTTVIVSLVHPTLFDYFVEPDAGAAFRAFLEEMQRIAHAYGQDIWFPSPYSEATKRTPVAHYTAPDFESRPDFSDVGHANENLNSRLLRTALKNLDPDESGIDIYNLREIPADAVFAAIDAARRAYPRDGKAFHPDARPKSRRVDDACPDHEIGRPLHARRRN